MTRLQYALFRAAARMMTPEELAVAKRLAESADQGGAAEANLRRFALEVLWERKRQEEKVAAA